MPKNKEEGTQQILPVVSRFYNGLIFRMSLGLMLFLLAVLTVNYFVVETRGREVIVQQADKLNDEIAKTITLSLREKLSAVETLGRSLAKLVIVLKQTSEELPKIIPELLNQPGMENMIAGGGVWPEPFVFDSSKERSAFFWARNAKDQKLEQINDYNDQSGRGYHHEEWYIPARYLDKSKVYWSKSYIDPHSREPMVTCTVPIYIEGEFSGVATVDLRLAGLSDFMAHQTKLMGGYAFALDRNDRLLSFPSIDDQRLTELSIDQSSGTEYPTLQMLAGVSDSLKRVEEELNRVVMQYELNQPLQKRHELDLLSQNLFKDSQQIGINEAHKIAQIILGDAREERFSRVTERGKFLSTLFDPLLKEVSSISILQMPDIGWNVVVAMPARYSDSVVSKITEGMMGLLFIFLVLAASLYLLLFNSVFLLPVNKITHQVRNLVSREDYVTMLKIKGSDELAQLASWFNIRTAQLAEALSSIEVRNKELSEAREAAEQANRSKNIFLASMSHDIRTPMNAIIGLSDALKKTKLSKDQSQYVQVITSSAQSLLSLINDIMDFSKIEANQLDLETIPFDFRQIMDECADLVSFQTNEKRLEFIYFVSPSIPRYVLGDPNRLRQILLNIACNAIKFTETGRVEVWVEVLSKNDQSIQLLIEIRDTGIGLSKDAQKKLFLPFNQADSTTTRKFGGTGLGLAISKYLVDLMGGSIAFRSEEGVGTTFSLKLKLKLDERRLSYIQPVKIAYSNVLVLGQNHFQNTVIERYLNSMACSVIIATSVQEWLDLLENSANENSLTICSAFDLLGDLNEINNKLQLHEKSFDFLCFANQSERYDLNAEALVKNLHIRFINYPLKLDDLAKSIQDFNQINLDKNIAIESNEHLPNLPLSLYKQKKILVVEDNKVNQQVLKVMLGYLGLTADVVNDGVEAIDAVKSQDYDVILMDWQMPRMDGLEATRKIRLLKDNKQPIIIAVTANAMSGDVEKCLQSGMNDYLSKPIEKDKLEITLRKWFAS